MVLGSHVILSFYGFWLPNDPRGSWSDFVGAWDLFRFGKATKLTDVRSVAKEAHDWQLRLVAKKSLRLPPVVLNGLQARAVGQGFARCSQKQGVEIWACAILPEHVHLVIGRHRTPVERIAVGLKSAATRELIAQKLHPFQELRSDVRKLPKCWGRGAWKVFLDSAKTSLARWDTSTTIPSKKVSGRSTGSSFKITEIISNFV
jgi:REP element-mobilizing transposase RayT